MTLVDAAGWIGGVVVLVAYLMVMLQRIESRSRGYQMMNIVGGVMLTCSALQAHAYPNLAINLVWIVGGSVALLNGRPRRSRRTREDFVAAA